MHFSSLDDQNNFIFTYNFVSYQTGQLSWINNSFICESFIAANKNAANNIFIAFLSEFQNHI